MKNLILFLIISLSISLTPLFSLVDENSSTEHMIKILDKYKEFLIEGTYQGQDWSAFKKPPLSRYDTFKIAFTYFLQNNGRVIVELGTSRSFVHGGIVGCNSDDTKYWSETHCENWDWGAGFFTRMAAESLYWVKPLIYTVDLIKSHINRCKIMTSPFNKIIKYHVSSSVDFLKKMPPKSIDLLYLDTGDMWPIEPTALLQLEEAIVLVERNLLSDNGLLLIDDVKNQTPKKFGEMSDLAKSKYSIPYLLSHGYEIIADEYQIIMKKSK